MRIRAERKLGEMLKAQRKSGGMKKGKLKRGTEVPQSHDATTEAPKLSDMGITKSIFSRARKIAFHRLTLCITLIDWLSRY
jgi:hypothetical protein